IAAKPLSQQPIVQRRVITPQTGPRPVYQAPPSAAGSGGVQRSTAPAGRPQGGVVRGQPIFQRRPMGGGSTAPAGRPQFGRPGDQRGAPDRPGPGRSPGAGPGWGVGPGLPPPAPGKPAGRAGAPPRRPGQLYIQGPKEGPMKGFFPPPRLTVSNEP